MTTPLIAFSDDWSTGLGITTDPRAFLRAHTAAAGRAAGGQDAVTRETFEFRPATSG